MRNLLRRLFLIKEIVSKAGRLHFQRWRLLSTERCSIYIHYIARSDEEKHGHTHPWEFSSIILKGGYIERVFDGTKCISKTAYLPGDIVKHGPDVPHKIKLIKPTWTLVFVGRYSRPDWGYHTEEGFMDHKAYFKKKDESRG